MNIKELQELLLHSNDKYSNDNDNYYNDYNMYTNFENARKNNFESEGAIYEY